MSIKRILAAALLPAALSAPFAAPALAQQAAGVTVGQLRWELVDLAPDDGIAPWIGVNAYATQSYASVYDQEGNEIDGVRIDAYGATGFDNAYASLHADTRADTASAQLALYSGYGYVSANRSFRFTLAPNTQVRFLADAAMWASPEAPGVSWPTALAELYGSLPGYNDGERFMQTFRLEDGAHEGTLAVTAASQGEWVSGYLALDAYAVAESHAAPVPEPAMAAMLMGGLGVLGALARRRKG
ncbi:PEP-CTERM sorting domain-containing protein [uncultured Massilia sp.]|uniref:PEP-CTERM sorting domain-containing protein n=1 Tax=uncultured Massilia sp. TaxID=169973 RepID=UPI0025DB044C|nr:PEP-CTERM sorting domain-containing protein [uncultured Massilia sp.]